MNIKELVLKIEEEWIDCFSRAGISDELAEVARQETERLILEWFRRAPANTMSPTDALCGFVAWITTRDEIVPAGASQDSAPWADLVNKFIQENGLGDPSKEFPHNIIRPNSGTGENPNKE